LQLSGITRQHIPALLGAQGVCDAAAAEVAAVVSNMVCFDPTLAHDLVSPDLDKEAIIQCQSSVL